MPVLSWRRRYHSGPPVIGNGPKDTDSTPVVPCDSSPGVPFFLSATVWSDFHSGLADEMRAQLNSVFQPRYVARLIPRATYDIVEVAERRGERPPLADPEPSAPYYVTLSRAHRRPVVEVWSIQLWEKLPVLP